MNRLPAAFALALAACGARPEPVVVEIPAAVAAPEASPPPPSPEAAPPRYVIECRSPRLALALVLDRSGSTTGFPLEMAKAGAIKALGQLSVEDLIEVIAFDGVAVRMRSARQPALVAEDIGRIQPSVGADMFSVLDHAYIDLSSVYAERKHVVLLSGGGVAVPSLFDLVQLMRSEGITVSTISVGPDADERLLERVATVGGGRFHHARARSILPELFRREVYVALHAPR